MIGRGAGPIEADVVVIGGGAAGAIAALAAREEGLRVTVVRRAFGATALSSGAADLAPDPVATAASPRGDRRSIRGCVEALALRRPDHPYAILRGRLAELDAAVAFTARATGGALSFAPLDGENRLLLSPLGTMKPTAGGLGPTLAGDLSGAAGTVGVAGFDLWPGHDARTVALGGAEAAGRAGLPVRLEAVLLDFLRGADDPLLRPHEVAARIAGPDGIERLAASIRRATAGRGIERLLLPPVLPGAEALAALERRCGIRCGEAPAGPPSHPGLRLQRLLDERLAAAGIELLHAEAVAPGGELHVRAATAPVADASLFDEGVEPRLPPPPALWPVRAAAVVLATGKFLGGGLARRNTIVETVHGLPAWLGDAVEPTRWPGDLTAHELAADQRYFRAGVRFDERLRPFGAGGGPARPDLFACGAVLSGNDAARDGAGLGLAVFTGYLAGREAAAQVRRRVRS